jgi:DNA-binding NtrC family response regulator
MIITGDPILQNAVAAVNKDADAYVMKPFDAEKMLQTIKEQPKKQNGERKFSEKSSRIYRNPSQRAGGGGTAVEEPRLNVSFLNNQFFVYSHLRTAQKVLMCLPIFQK